VLCVFFFFFFQAEDGIRDFHVTGVQTCALPILSSPENIARLDAIRADLDRIADPRGATQAQIDAVIARTPAVVWFSGSVHGDERSEERRVGEEWRWRAAPEEVNRRGRGRDGRWR